jgi:hypothetical protein
MTNQERIEAYFDNQLSADEQKDLFSQLESDASLKKEFEFQEEIVEGLKAYRKQQLINRLDNVRVASGAQSMWLKAAGLVGAAIVLTGAAYWMYSIGSDTQTKITQDTKIEEVAEQKMLVEPEQENPTLTKEDQVIQEDPIKESETAVKTTKETLPETTTKTTNTGLPKVQVPEMTEPGQESTINLEEDLEAPEAMASEAISVKSNTDVLIKLSKKYPFHYQVKDGDLTLFGDFGDTTFEVIELKTTTGINSYLFYKENFYQLKDNSNEIQPLRILENENVVEALKKRR